jgi:hypothetical protein
VLVAAAVADTRGDDEGSVVLNGAILAGAGLSIGLGASAVYGYVRTGRCLAGQPSVASTAAR